MSDRKPARCHDCHCAEGQFHDPGCDMERCPFCGGQLITCDCAYELMGIDNSFGTWAYKHGLTNEQSARWDQMLTARGRVPYIQWKNVCAYCGELWPEMFMVDDAKWRQYIQQDRRDVILCRDCYNWIRQLIDRRSDRCPKKRRN